jgi:hypothetical protein
MFPIVLSINLVNLINLTAVGGLIYYFYSKNVLSMDVNNNLTFLKPKNHLLPVNINEYREKRLEYIQTVIDEYNALFDASLLLVEEDDNSSDTSDSDDDEDDNEESVKEETTQTECQETVDVNGEEKEVEKVSVVVEEDVDNIESAN